MSLAAVIERSCRDREGWTYTSLKPLADTPFVPVRAAPEKAGQALPSILDETAQRHQIVFVNGIWQPELSKLGELAGILKGDAANGYRLELAGQTCLVTAPVELVFLTDTGDTAGEVNMRLSIELGASGRLTLIEHHVAPDGKAPAALVHDVDVRLDSQAKLVHGRVIAAGETVSWLGRGDIRIGEGAYYDSFTLVTGGRLVRNETESRLTGKLAQCSLNSVMLLRGSAHADTTTHILHEVPFGTSHQVCKSVLAGKARGVFQGRITVAEDAQKSDATQLSRALLLSDQAEMDAKPELYIHADDVTCSHGAAIGALDDNALFYLRSRGIGEDEARALLIRGFIGETIDDIQVPEWRAYARRLAEVWCDE
ncbi:MAG: Fe-S cluster assembly protein SufD [Bdellovibrionales bacterium]